MELYDSTSEKLAKIVTKRYSTSFSLSSLLFKPAIRRDIYSIYGMVRIADEIVDTYKGVNAKTHLNELEQQITRALQEHYSTNPIVHAFAMTASKYGIDNTMVKPFFNSMRTDLTATRFTLRQYHLYIYGSAEVVGLMCLKVFTAGNASQYKKLRKGAQALGAAYQKINFLRDIRADHEQLGRVYFPGVDYSQFNDTDKQQIIADIERDFSIASTAISQLPPGARKAVNASYLYYKELLTKLKATPAETIKSERVRIPNWRKLYLLAKAGIVP